MNFYAKLNSERVCEQIVSTPNVIKNTVDYVAISNYNDDLVYRKWDGEQWSEKKYQPELSPVIQEKLDEIEELKEKMEAKDKTIAELKAQINTLSDTIDFVLSQGGDK